MTPNSKCNEYIPTDCRCSLSQAFQRFCAQNPVVRSLHAKEGAAQSRAVQQAALAAGGSPPPPFSVPGSPHVVRFRVETGPLFVVPGSPHVVARSLAGVLPWHNPQRAPPAGSSGSLTLSLAREGDGLRSASQLQAFVAAFRATLGARAALPRSWDVF